MVSDRPHALTKTADSLRASVSTDSMPAVVAPTDAAAVLLTRLEARQVEVVQAVGESLEVVGEVVGELRESVAEDERVRKEVRELTTQVTKMRTALRVAVYACVTLVAVAVAVSVVSSLGQMRLAEQGAERVRIALEQIDSIAVNTEIALRVILKQADAHAKGVEAEAALTPQSEHDALEAAIEAQEEAAEASIDVARQRRVPPPPGAERALVRAREKKAALKPPPDAAPMTYP